LGEAPQLLKFLRSFYKEEHLAFDPAIQGHAVRELLHTPTLGAAFFLRPGDSGGPAAALSAPLGHLVLTHGFSLEFGGPFVLLDELCLTPAVRGKGEGQRAVAFAAAWARNQGARALRLEVARDNLPARHAYERAGLCADKRDLMTFRLH